MASVTSPLASSIPSKRYNGAAPESDAANKRLATAADGDLLSEAGPTAAQLNGASPQRPLMANGVAPTAAPRLSSLDTKMQEDIPLTDVAATPTWAQVLASGASVEPFAKVPAFSTAQDLVEKTSYEKSTAIFVYEAVANAGFGVKSEQWAAEGKGGATAPKVFSLQTRAGAATAIIGYLHETGASSKDAVGATSAGSVKVVTAYTNSSGLAAMSPALASASLPSSSRLILQVSAQRQLEDSLVVVNDYASIFAAVAHLGDKFTVLLSSDPQEAAENAAAAYAAHGNVLHVFDGAHSARQLSALTTPTSNALPSAFTYHGAQAPEAVLVIPNSANALAAAAVLASSQTSSAAVGILVARVLRPWSDVELRQAIPASAKTLHVLEETASRASIGPLYEDVLTSLYSDAFSASQSPSAVFPVSVSVDTKLGAREWAVVLATLATHPSKALDLAGVLAKAEAEAAPSVAPDAKVCLFWDGDAADTSSTAQLAAHTFLANESVDARLQTRYDNFAASGLQLSQFVLAPLADPSVAKPPLQLLADGPNSAHFVSIADPSVLKAYDVFTTVRPGATVLLNCNWTPNEFDAKLTALDKRQIANRQLKLFAIDTAAVLSELEKTSTAHAVGAGKAKQAIGVDSTVASAVLFVAFMSLYSGQHGGLAALVAPALQAAPLGEGVSPNAVVAATNAALVEVPVRAQDWAAAEPASEAELNAPARPISLVVNSFGPNPFGNGVPEAKPVRSNWARPAWQLLFREAYHTDTSSLRPDLPEENFVVTVTENRRLTPATYDRNVFHMEFDTSGTGLKYEVGEALGIHGWNDEGEVREFIEWIGFDPNEIVTGPSATQPGKVESRTVFQLLQQNLDIFGKPPKRFYEALSGLATDRNEAMWLRFISSAEGASTLKKMTDKDTVTYADVLRMFPSAKLTVDKVIELVEPIKPRHYSIASSQKAVGDSVHLLIVTVDWLTPTGSPRYGQCTRYLADLSVGAKVTVSIKPSVMKLPPLDGQPIIMAGLGTGAAPFRAFIQHRAWQKAQGVDVGPLIYYFGSRYQRCEYLYGEELEAYQQDGIVSHMGLAFSRDGPRKVYIQHKMLEDAEFLAQYIRPNDPFNPNKGVFYLCGPTWPVPDVYEALTKALESKGLGKEEAQAYLEEMKEEERYVLEVY